MERILIVEDDALLNKTLAYDLASDGWEVASALNARTAAGLLAGGEYDLVQESDQPRGYEAGAVDYITKPFSIEALHRKIRAMFAMLGHRGPARDLYDDGRLFLDFSEQAASLNGEPIALSPMEYRMLHLFCKNPRQVLTRQRLLERLWDADERFVDEHTLTTSISRIRGKIEADGDTYIKTIYGIGYQWTGGERR